MTTSKTEVDGVKLEAGGAVPTADSGASIDKVRDILFGNQMREFERRFARLEERLRQGDERPQGRHEEPARRARDVRTKDETESLAGQHQGRARRPRGVRRRSSRAS